VNEGYSHAEQIELLIEKSLKEAKLDVKDLDAVSVSKGPGSYTGLRIGVSIAKGLCFGLNIPLISVPTLDAMANHPNVLAHTHSFKAPMLDARRMEVYACILNDNAGIHQKTAAIVIDENSFIDTLNQHKLLFFGPGMEKCKTQLSIHKNAFFEDDILPSAQQMVQISEEKLLKKDVEDTAYFEPFYLKDFVAGKPKKLV
jgi:tRNA threonylcarbamoyladenosine biosynthesis protein TsaB